MIALLGASGAVGRSAVEWLNRWGVQDIRLGSRSSGVDIYDDGSLAEFVTGADLVANCVGPSHRSAARVAEAAVAAGADHVDAGGADVVVGARGRRVVFAAGASPGLSGVLPRWLASGFDSVHALTQYCGVLDRFTEAGAEDYLNGVNEPLAAWRDRELRSGVLTRLSDVELPFFEGLVAAFSFMDAENEAVARSLSLVDGQWYSVVEGSHLRSVLGTLSKEALCRATALDVAGRAPRVTFLVQLDGLVNGKAASKTAVLRAGGVAELAGFVTASAARAVLLGGVPVGCHRAAAVLDKSIMDELDVTVFDETIGELTVVEEGAL